MARKALGPASLKVVAAVDGWLVGSGTNLIGVSGGADSMALAAAAAHVGRRDGVRVAALVVDHGLHPDSAAITTRVLGRLEDIGVQASSVRVTVPDSPDGVEAAARDARYGALLGADSSRVFVGHTLDDQAETVMLGLARGSGLRSIAGMAPLVGRVCRPLLNVRRADTRQACREWGIETWHDPANDDPDFLRVRVRASVLPTLVEQLGDGIAANLARTARLARCDVEALESWASTVLETAKEDDGRLCVKALTGEPEAIQTRVIRAWLADLGIAGLDAERTWAVHALVVDWHGQKGITLPGGRRVLRRAGCLELIDRPASPRS